jgi:hypothetical protein
MLTLILMISTSAWSQNNENAETEEERRQSYLDSHCAFVRQTRRYTDQLSGYEAELENIERKLRETGNTLGEPGTTLLRLRIDYEAHSNRPPFHIDNYVTSWESLFLPSPKPMRRLISKWWSDPQKLVRKLERQASDDELTKVHLMTELWKRYVYLRSEEVLTLGIYLHALQRRQRSEDKLRALGLATLCD